MIANIKEFEKKLIDKDLNYKKLAELIGLTPITLSQKVKYEGHDFKFRETKMIAEIFELTCQEYKTIFFGVNFSQTKENDLGGSI